MDNKIYKEAILDAKALRAGAIANAKSIMQEALEPAIQEMMRLKLSEELEDDLEEGTYEEVYEEEGAMKEEGVDEVTDATLEEILAELDELDGQEEGAINEAEGDDEDEEEIEADEEAVTDELPAVKPMDTKLIKLTLGDLKAALMPQAAEMGDEAGEESEEAPLSLDEILAEMEAEKYEEGKDEVNESLFGLELLIAKAAIVAVPGLIAALIKLGKNADKKALIAQAEKEAAAQGKELSPEEKAKLDSWASKNVAASAASGRETSPLGEADKDHAMQNELKMAKETIAELRESINEINLLNAKLLYMNKIFKAKSLTESEKVKVVKAFDRNASIKEVKNTYETLKESIQAKKSQVIKESVGFASKPIGVAPKTNIVEADAFVNRWQKIAGIK
jgi:hypothetical protein